MSLIAATLTAMGAMPPARLRTLDLLQRTLNAALPSERGLGDVLLRLYGDPETKVLDTPAFRDWHRRAFGIDCRCRQPLAVDFNARYPLP